MSGKKDRKNGRWKDMHARGKIRGKKEGQGKGWVGGGGQEYAEEGHREGLE
jgi:hypothetical protein